MSIALALRDAQRSLYISEVTELIGRDKSLVSRHCKVLWQAGLLNRNLAGRRHYWVSEAGAALIDAVMDEPVDH